MSTSHSQLRQLTTWDKNLPAVSKKHQAAVLVDKDNCPTYFVLDTLAMLDLLSDIDAALLEKVSDEDYYNPAVNPAGQWIDSIEQWLPYNKKLDQSLPEIVTELQEKGYLHD